MTPERSSDILASIDLGSHTARLLAARWKAGRLESLLRRRAYVRLAQDFESPESRTLKQSGIERALNSLEAFKWDIERVRAGRTRAVATGVVRAAANRAALPGLDQGRVAVILAGSVVVAEILNFFRSSEMMISVSDLLEGALLEVLGVPWGSGVA